MKQSSQKNILTIGIPVYNNTCDLLLCLESLKHSTVPYELLIVDDASTENVRSVVGVAIENGWLSDAFSVCYMRNSHNRGFPHNANVILAESNGKIVCILNSDTYVCPGSFEQMCEVLDNDDDVLVAGPSTCSANSPQALSEYMGNTRISESEILARGEVVRKRYGDEVVALAQESTNSQVQGFCYLIKREAIERVGYFDEVYKRGMFEESDFDSRVEHLGYRALWVKGAYVHHFGGASFERLTFATLRRVVLFLRNMHLWKKKRARMTQNNVKDVYRTAPDYTKERML